MPNEKLIALLIGRVTKNTVRSKRRCMAFWRGAEKPIPRQKPQSWNGSRVSSGQSGDVDFFKAREGRTSKCFYGEPRERRKKRCRDFEAKNYRGKTWLTRPRPEIDRVGSAWLIRRFIDPRAKFVFAAAVPPNRESPSVRYGGRGVLPSRAIAAHSRR